MRGRRMSSRKTIEGVTFRMANVDDVSALVELYTNFFDEAVYKDHVTFDPMRVYKHLNVMIEHGLKPHILAFDRDAKLVGFISYTLDDYFSVAPVAVMGEFYVIPERRHSALGRALLALVIDMAKGDGACAFHAPVASGIKHSRSLGNLLTKGGFEQIGFIMRRGL